MSSFVPFLLVPQNSCSYFEYQPQWVYAYHHKKHFEISRHAATGDGDCLSKCAVDWEKRLSLSQLLSHIRRVGINGIDSPLMDLEVSDP